MATRILRLRWRCQSSCQLSLYNIYWYKNINVGYNATCSSFVQIISIPLQNSATFCAYFQHTKLKLIIELNQHILLNCNTKPSIQLSSFHPRIWTCTTQLTKVDFFISNMTTWQYQVSVIKMAKKASQNTTRVYRTNYISTIKWITASTFSLPDIHTLLSTAVTIAHIT